MKITAIIPSYNAEAYLAEAIGSVLAQTRQVAQIIVVDDCSTDGSREVAARFPVELLSTPQNSGHATARNVGIAAATGDVIAWLDADDRWDPNHCEVVCGLLEEWPEAAVAFSGVRMFGGQAGEFGHKAACLGTPRNVFWECVHNTIVPAMTAVTRTSAIRDVGGFDGAIRIAPDYDLWVRLSRRHPFVSSGQITASYRMHSSQISAQPLRQLRSVYEGRLRCLRRLESEGDAASAARLRGLMVAWWEKDLRRLWRARDIESLRYVLNFSDLVPDRSDLAQRMFWRARWPQAAILAWDRLRNRVRSARASRGTVLNKG